MLKTNRHLQTKGPASSQNQGACKHKSCKSSKGWMLLALLCTSSRRVLQDRKMQVVQPCTPTTKCPEHHTPHCHRWAWGALMREDGVLAQGNKLECGAERSPNHVSTWEKAIPPRRPPERGYDFYQFCFESP